MVEGFGLPPFLFLEVDFMRKIWVRFFCFVFCLCFLISNRNYIVYASGSVNNYFVERCSSVSSTSYYYSSGHIVSGNNIYIYRDTVSTSANVDLYFLSDAPFTFTVDGLSTTYKDKFDALMVLVLMLKNLFWHLRVGFIMLLLVWWLFLIVVFLKILILLLIYLLFIMIHRLVNHG